jgi:hypothetical protein
VQADVFLLTDRQPALLPDPNGLIGAPGLTLDHAAPATDRLLTDLRSDKGMGWVPQHAWLTKIGIDAAAPELRFDLAIDASGKGQPSLRDAGFSPFGPAPAPPPVSLVWLALVAVAMCLPLGAVALITAAARTGGGGRPMAGA